MRGKIFATVPDDTHLRVMVDEDEIRAVAAANPRCVCRALLGGSACRAWSWTCAGPRRALVEELLTDAWARKAPKKLVDEFEAGGRP